MHDVVPSILRHVCHLGKDSTYISVSVRFRSQARRITRLSSTFVAPDGCDYPMAGLFDARNGAPGAVQQHESGRPLLPHQRYDARVPPLCT